MVEPLPRRVLITGGAGFIGANLARALYGLGHSVSLVVRPTTSLWRLAGTERELHLLRADLADPEAVARVVAEAKPEVLFHLAFHSGHPTTPEAFRAMVVDGLLGTWNLLDAISATGIKRYVHVGSSTEYGPRSRPIAESDCLDPVILRGVAKASTTLLCRQMARQRGLPCIILRPFSVYGYWESPARFIPTALSAALRGEPLALTRPGVSRDLVFVEDMIEACMLAIDADASSGDVINLGTGRRWSNEAIVAMIGDLAGRPISSRIGDYPQRPVDSSHGVANIWKAKALLGWTPRHSLPLGLKKTYDWYVEHRNLYEAHTDG